MKRSGSGRHWVMPLFHFRMIIFGYFENILCSPLYPAQFWCAMARQPTTPGRDGQQVCAGFHYSFRVLKTINAPIFHGRCFWNCSRQNNGGQCYECDEYCQNVLCFHGDEFEQHEQQHWLSDKQKQAESFRTLDIEQRKRQNSHGDEIHDNERASIIFAAWMTNRSMSNFVIAAAILTI